VYVKGRIQCKICFHEEKERISRKELLDEFMRRLETYVEAIVSNKARTFGRGNFPEGEMLRKSLSNIIGRIKK